MQFRYFQFGHPRHTELIMKPSYANVHLMNYFPLHQRYYLCAKWREMLASNAKQISFHENVGCQTNYSIELYLHQIKRKIGRNISKYEKCWDPKYILQRTQFILNMTMPNFLSSTTIKTGDSWNTYFKTNEFEYFQPSFSYFS